MKPMISSKGTLPSKRAKKAESLTNRAMKHPGVADLMEVYEAWQKYEKMMEAHDVFRATRQTTAVSSSSGPLLRDAR